MSEEIFRISKSIERAKALLEMAEDRFIDIKRETKIYKIIEQYYEVIKETITSLMYAKGLKTLSHRALGKFLEEKYKDNFKKEEFILINELRRLRNDILYYGKKIPPVFLKNRETEIKQTIKKLLEIGRKEIKRTGY